MARFYSPLPVISGEPLALSEVAAHHARAVLRLSVGDSVEVFDGHSGAYVAVIIASDKKGVRVLPGDAVQPHLPPENLHLWFSPLKKEACNFLVQKAVEIGVGHLHPVQRERTCHDHFPTLKRRQTVIDAAQQCRLTALPILHEPITAAEEMQVLRQAPPGMVLWADEAGGMPITQALAAAECAIEHIIIGPEGGFSPAERAAFNDLPGIVRVTLGPRIMRAETAALVVASLVVAWQQDLRQ